MVNHAKEASELKNLRRDFERFCYKHRYKGISNLMLYIAIGTAVVYLFSMIDPSNLLVRVLCFDRSAILSGQVWRLFTYIIVPSDSRVFWLAVSLYLYYVIGKSIEDSWGPFRFNLFYLCGVVFTDLGALLMNVSATTGFLNLSLFLAYATMYPENRVLLMFIIPIKMKYLAWFYFALTLYELFVYPFPYNMLSIIVLLNYFLFFGSDVLRVLPDFLQPRGRGKRFGSFGQQNRRPNPNWAKEYQKTASQPLYRHKCSVCGRTDTENPYLEFRYCSRCKGYHCYCIEHINNHAHVE